MGKWKDWHDWNDDYTKILKKKNAFERKHKGKHNMSADQLEKFSKIELEVKDIQNHPERPASRSYSARWL